LGNGNPTYDSPTTTTTYTVTGTSLGCSSSTTITVAASSVDINGNVINHVSCPAGNDGSASVNVLLGTAPFTYSWSPIGGSGSTATGLPAGTYLVTVTDSLGCYDTATIVILQPEVIIGTITDTTHVECFGASTGSATVGVTGGTSPYTYLWMPAGGTGATTTPIPAGTYQVTITDDHGCTATTQVTIQQPPDLNISISAENETCPGTCNGSASALATGGTPPYSFSWGTVPPTPGQSISDLCSGDYTVYVTDGNNCVFSETANVTTNSNANAIFSAFPYEGVIPLNVQFSFGGTGVTYLWDFGDGTTSTLSDPSHLYTVNGIYTVTLIVTSGPPDYCADTFRMDIHAIQPSSLIMPNVFTPNNDGFNDVFAAEVVAIETMKVVIYNRWGKVVYEWNDPAGGWDGQHKTGGECADGTYYYILEAKGFDGVVYNLSGTVTLLK
jgi:gliding motility-associated-like protein